MCDFVYCSADAGDERGPQYMAAYLQSVLEHYEILGDHFEGLKGYDAYASAATVLRRMGETGFMKGFLEATASGTPDHILETYRRPLGAARPVRGGAGVPLRRRARTRTARPACACSPPRSCPAPVLGIGRWPGVRRLY